MVKPKGLTSAFKTQCKAYHEINNNIYC